MSNFPSKQNPLYLIAFLLFLSFPGFCGQEALNSSQKQARAYREQGVKLQKEGNISGAITSYQKALLLDPNYVVLYNDVGIMLEAKGEIEQAKDMYLKAIEIAPNYPNSYTNLALLCEGQKDYANAIVYWIKRVTLGDPEDPWTEVARDRLQAIVRASAKSYDKVGKEYGEDLGQQNAESKPEEPLDEDAASGKEIDRVRSIEYLDRAKETFAKGDYMAALNEANIAEYLDPSNTKISVFIEKVRKQILH
jgi:tetratricopeptide (TPR) repeat protein